MIKCPESTKDVILTISKAVAIMRLFPAVKVQGFYNIWTRLTGKAPLKDVQDATAEFENGTRPSPKEIDMMWDVCFKWLYFIDIDARHLVWLRCSGMGWKQVAFRFHISRSTAIRRFNEACETIYNALKKQKLAV